MPLVTDPGTEIFDLCQALNHPAKQSNAPVHRALPELLKCEERDSHRLYSVLAAFETRFNILQRCLEQQIREDKSRLDRMNSLLARTELFYDFSQMNTTWEHARAQSFSETTLSFLETIGVALRQAWPLTKLISEERAKHLNDIGRQLEQLRVEATTSSVASTLINTLETLYFMLDKYDFFGTVAVKDHAQAAYMQVDYFERRAVSRGEEKEAAILREVMAAIVALGITLATFDGAVNGAARIVNWTSVGLQFLSAPAEISPDRSNPTITFTPDENSYPG